MIVLRILFVILSIYVCLCILIYFFQDKLIFYPEKLPRDYKYQLAGEFEEINFKIPDGAVINAIKMKAQNTKGVIFYSHGNAGNLAGWADVGTTFVKRGYDFLIYDYRGYGKSTGRITEKNLYNDAQFIYDKLKKEYSENKIIIYGRSLGTGVSSYLGMNNSPKLLILETPYYNFVSLAKTYYPIFPTFILKYKFEVSEHLRKIKCPISIIHGTDDEVVPYSSGLKLKSLLKDGDRFITVIGGHHNDLSAYKEYHSELDRL